MTTKRILIFSLAYFPHVGGAEVALKEITDRITTIEFHMVTLRFSPNEKESEKIGNIMVHRVGGGSSYKEKILFVPRAVRRAHELHTQLGFDALWAMMSYMLFPVTLLYVRGVRLPYVLTLQEGDPWEHMFGRWFILPFRPLLTFGFKHARVIQAISHFLAGWAKRAGYPGIPVVIPNGYIDPKGNTDIEWFGTELGSQKRDIFWKNQVPPIHITDETKILITTSRLVHKNAVDDVIRALPFLPEQIIFVIFGDGVERRNLEKLALGLGVRKRVYFRGEVANTKVLLYLHASDIFIRPSRSEGMGNSFIEAMAAGLPVIATQEGGIADFLFDVKRNPDKEATGWAVDKNAPRQIADAVIDILAHPEQAKNVVSVAKKLVDEKYNWRTIAQEMNTKVFERLGGS